MLLHRPSLSLLKEGKSKMEEDEEGEGDKL